MPFNKFCCKRISLHANHPIAFKDPLPGRNLMSICIILVLSAGHSFSSEEFLVKPERLLCRICSSMQFIVQVKAASISTSGGQAARAELGLGDDFYETSSGQRERMLQSTERLNKTGDRIRQGRQQLLETEVCAFPGALDRLSVSFILCSIEEGDCKTLTAHPYGSHHKAVQKRLSDKLFSRT